MQSTPKATINSKPEAKEKMGKTRLQHGSDLELSLSEEEQKPILAHLFPHLIDFDCMLRGSLLVEP
jgi:hypothetical protein